MLISYRFNNFCSFWGEYEFSMEAPGGKVMRRYPDNYVKQDTGVSCLKTAVIVGENAGGKSNFMESLQYLKSLFADNAEVKTFPPYLNVASKEEAEVPCQSFELKIVSENGKIYRYLLEIDAIGIRCEELYMSSSYKSRETPLFTVRRSVEMTRPQYDISGVSSNQILRGHTAWQPGIGLVITKFAILGDEHALAVTSWVNDQLSVEKSNRMEQDSLKRLNSDLEILKDPRYVEIFRMVDYSICGIEVDEEKPYSKTVIIRKNKEGQELRRELSMDSAGVREFFRWAVQIHNVVYENKTIFADEMDRVLNPVLSDRVIAFINGKQHHGQFIFSTHNVLHLNLVTYMKEQIYFITKDKDTLISELYSLADFPEVRYETTKIYEFYMKGILGGTAYE
ncbi:MAG: ATP-binding protein [Lachnospiraceae bacterium]|nr:ATP-binding protein [Lachnospiraceae bacterium]